MTDQIGRELFRGEVSVEYGQLLVLGDSWEGSLPELELAFAGQRNGLLGGAEPGALVLITGMHTGYVPIVVELHDVAPPRRTVDEEDVVEATLVPGSNTSGSYALVTLMSDPDAEIQLDQRPHRVRYHVNGMDEAHQSGVRRRGEPEVDHYRLQLWPVAEATPDAVLAVGSGNAAYWHRTARERPTREEVLRQRAEAEQAERLRREAAERDARERPEHHRWGGAPPAEHHPVADLEEGPSIYKLDRSLALDLAELPAASQRRIMFWLIDRAVRELALTEVAGLVAEIDALRAGAPPTRPFQQQSLSEAENMLVEDEHVTLRSEFDLHDVAYQIWPIQNRVLAALRVARRPHPGNALFGVLENTAAVFGGHRYTALFTELRAALPELTGGVSG